MDQEVEKNVENEEVPVEESLEERLQRAIVTTAPGTAVRRALDMIIAGHLGALICVGDTETVLGCWQ